MKVVSLLLFLIAPEILACSSARAADPKDQTRSAAAVSNARPDGAASSAPPDFAGVVLVGPGEMLSAFSTNACPGEPDPARGCRTPGPDLRGCRDGGKGQCLTEDGTGYSVHLETPRAAPGARVWASACWELVPQDGSAFNELEVGIRNVKIPGDVHFKLEKSAMGSGGEVFASIHGPGKISVDASNFRSQEGVSVLPGPERFCVVLLPRAGDPRPREVEFTVDQVALRSNLKRQTDELVLVGLGGRVVDYSGSECDPCRDSRKQRNCPARSAVTVNPDATGGWNLDLLAQRRAKRERSWSSSCWELTPLPAVDMSAFRELAVEVGPVAMPGEVLFKLEDKKKGDVARAADPVCPRREDLAGREVLEWIGAPQQGQATRTVVLNLDNFKGDPDDDQPAPKNIARLCAVSSPPEDGPTEGSHAAFDIRRVVLRKAAAKATPSSSGPTTASKRELVLVGNGGRVKSYSFSRSAGATAKVTRTDDEWELEIAAPNKPGSYSGVCWDLNPLAVDDTVFNHLVIEVRAVGAPSRAHIKMERPNWLQHMEGLMRVSISDPGDLRLNLAGFRKALPRLGRFCIQSLPGSGSSPRTSFTLGRVYLSE